jgi:hypothetical protein
MIEYMIRINENRTVIKRVPYSIGVEDSETMILIVKIKPAMPTVD